MRHSLPFLIGISLFSLLMIACQPGGMDASNMEEAKNAVAELTEKFTEAHIEKDITFLNSLFAEDAKIYPPNAEMVMGNEAISAINEEWVNYGIQEMTEVSINMSGHSELIVDEGRYDMVYGPDNFRETGNYINIWKKVDGQWKIQSNMWNSDMPAPRADAGVAAIQVVKLKSSLSKEDLLKKAHERAKEFRALPGLIQKYYLEFPEPGTYMGIYLWDSEESKQEYLKSDLIKTIAPSYKVTEAPRIEFGDLLFRLRE